MVNEDEPIYYRGLELEVECPRTPAVYKVLRKSGYDLFRFENDSSLRNGFEIITAPMSKQYWQTLGFEALKKLIQKLENASNHQITSWDNGRCGLHIHFNKSDLNFQEQYEILQFMIKNKTFINTISGRKNFKYCKPAVIEYYNIDYQREMIENTDRRLSINFINDTIEFRFYRGTLKTENIKAGVDLIENIILYCKKCVKEENESTLLGLIKYIEDKEYINQFIRERYKVLSSYQGCTELNNIFLSEERYKY